MSQSNIEDVYVLSPMQEGLLFHTLLSPDEHIYHKQLNMRIEAKDTFRSTAFKQACQQIMERHSVLRSAFSWENRKRPLQVVLKHVELPIVLLDWSTLSPDEQEERLHLLQEEDRSRGFQLTQVPLMRLTLITLSEQVLQCVLSYHHLLFDGWSVPLLLNELFSLYNAICQQKPAQMEHPRPYKDYIAWIEQQDTLQAEHFWRSLLRGFQAPNKLRLNKPASGKTEEFSAPYEKLELRLPVSTTQVLRHLARQHHLTLNTLIQGAWALLLSRYSGDRDVVFGITVSGRPVDLSGMESMIGLFINTLPLRIQLSPEEQLLPWLQSLQLQQAHMLSYEYSSLAQVQAWSELSRDINQPLFETLVAFENFPGERIQNKPDSSLQLVGVLPEIRTNYPLTVMVAPGERLTVLIGYDSGRFTNEAIARLARHLEVILTALPVSLQRRLADISMLTQEEEQNQRIHWNAAQRQYSLKACFHQLFEAQVERTPYASAVSWDSIHLTYQQLNKRANQLAHFLRERGVGPETCVGLLVEHSIEALVGILAVFKAGGAYVPLDLSYPKERLTFILTGVCFLLTQQHLLPLLPEHHPEILCLDSEWSKIATHPSENLAVVSTPENLAYCMYTSGSTGVPKGVMITQRSLVNYALWTSETLLGANVHCQPATSRLSFDASLKQLFPPLLRGDCVWMVPSNIVAEPAHLLQELCQAKHAGLSCIPSLWTLILHALETRPQALPDDCLAALYLGGERVSQELARRTFDLFPNLALWNVYGPTETTANSLVACLSPGDEIHIGMPIANTQVYLLDERLNLVAPGLPGEIYIGGAGLARGYLNQADASAEKFLPHPFSLQPGARLYKTGDIARYRQDGSIEYLERRDHQMKVRGFRIEAGEIEYALLQCPSVREAIVRAHEDAPGELRLLAYVVLHPETTVTDNDLRQFLQQRLPEYMLPAAFLRLEALPLSRNGKIDYHALAALDELRPVLTVAYVKPQSELEQQIAALWRDLLHVERVGIHDNFFDLGGHSLHLIRVYAHLQKQAPGLSLVDLFRYPTIQRLAAFLSQDNVPEESSPTSAPSSVEQSVPSDTQNELKIAIVGMAGRFPGADSSETFWSNLCEGKESITFFSDEELLETGVTPEQLADPHYVKAHGMLDRVEYFDAAFFGYTPREAEIMDPQQRIFLETAWQALEDAGYDPQAVPGRVGVYAGMGAPSYLFFHLLPRRELFESLGGFQLMLGSGNDALTTRVAYKLNLEGPGVTVQTACSTSLVAIHLACQSLLQGACDMALAGGISIGAFRKSGYRYQEGGIASPDGHCRAFDEQAGGTTFGNGGGIVVLKRLDKALATGDQIYAVILGSAINNDGSDKVGYTAPSIQGQARVISEALASACVEADTLSYIEAHGTGTLLGDPIEVAALTQAFRRQTQRQGFCGLGTVKSNIGHLDAAAGVAGVMKTALALYHRQIPATLHIQQPNTHLELERSPFFLNTHLRDWPEGTTPRRAGVSAFGVGGTNAHLILQEPPVPERVLQVSEEQQDVQCWHLLPFSARTPSALQQQIVRLSEHVQSHPEQSLADIAYTLQVGRHPFLVRSFVLACDLPDALSGLQYAAQGNISLHFAPEVAPPVAFLFPGGGVQHILMGRDLWRHDALFREQLEDSIALFPAWLVDDLRALLTDSDMPIAQQETLLRQTRWALPALFCLEYALAQHWLAWGVRPQALLGHSLGEYVAACLAGVFTPWEAAQMVLERSLLFERLPKGAMLSVSLSEEEVLTCLPDELSLAASNAPGNCVISGPRPAIEVFAHRLRTQGGECQVLPLDVAAHSQLIEAILEPFVQRVATFQLRPPQIPFISNVTGTWITASQATNPHYWGQHLRQTVRFGQGVRTLIQEQPFLLLEVGPGRTLSSLARQTLSLEGAAGERALPSMRHHSEAQDDRAALLQALGKLWVAGVTLHREALYRTEHRKRVSLPTYPFERQRYWIDVPQQSKLPEQRAGNIVKTPGGNLPPKTEVADWFYLPSWKRTLPMALSEPASSQDTWLIFLDRFGLGSSLAEHLRKGGAQVQSVSVGSHFAMLDKQTYQLNPDDPADYLRLASCIRQGTCFPRHLLHTWSLLGTEKLSSDLPGFQQAQRQGYSSLLWWLQAWEQSELLAQEPNLAIHILTDHLHAITAGESSLPEQAPLLALCRIIQQEYLSLSCRCLDLILPTDLTTLPLADSALVRGILAELLSPMRDLTVALRGFQGLQRWLPCYEQLHRPSLQQSESVLRPHGVYLLTGGLGRIAQLLAHHLAEHYQARLVLVTRTPLPERATWQEWLESHTPDEATSLHLRRLLALEEAGAELQVIPANVSSHDEMRQAIQAILARFGTLHGIFHTAGITRGPSISSPLMKLDARLIEEQFAPKVTGLYALEEALNAVSRARGEGDHCSGKLLLDFCLLFSSNASVLGGLGFGAYGAANAFMDAFASNRSIQSSFPWISATWDGWPLTAEEQKLDLLQTSMTQYVMHESEAVEALERVLSFRTGGQIVVSTGALEARLRLWVQRIGVGGPAAAGRESEAQTHESSLYPRPRLKTVYVAPEGAVEQQLAAIWQEMFGIEELGVHDNFFELGGHSLLATQIISRTRKAFHLEIPLSSLFEHPTLAGQTTVIIQLLTAQIDAGILTMLADDHHRENGKVSQQFNEGVTQ